MRSLSAAPTAAITCTAWPSSWRRSRASWGAGIEELEQVRLAAELHDVGKAALPSALLEKSLPLDDAEREYIQRHSVIGERILHAAPALHTVARLIRWSHERYDGAGYPDHLSGREIPLGARIISVCDAFDAMISNRPYRDAKASRRP